MMRYKLLLAVGLLMSSISGWAYQEVLEKIIKEQNVERLKALVPEINASRWRPEMYARSLVIMAVSTRNVELAGLILDIERVAMDDYANCTALCVAVKNEDAEMVKLLLSRGIDPHGDTRWGTATKNTSDELMPLFLTAPQFLSERLVTKEQTSTLRRLLKKKYIDPNLALNKEQDRPLHVLLHSMMSRDMTYCFFPKNEWNMWIRNGADPELKNAHGETPHDLFVKKNGEYKWIELMKNALNSESSSEDSSTESDDDSSDSE